MPQIDLDDLPPKIANLLAALREGDELVLVQGGAVAGRLAVAEAPKPVPTETLDDLPPEERMQEVMAQFNSQIHDEF